MQIWRQINLLILESDFARLYAGLNSRNALREYLKTSNCDNIFTEKKKAVNLLKNTSYSVVKSQTSNLHSYFE